MNHIKNDEHFLCLCLHLLHDHIEDVYYKSISHPLQQMHRYETVQREEYNRLSTKCGEKMTLADKYEKDCPQFRNTLEQFRYI